MVLVLSVPGCMLLELVFVLVAVQTPEFQGGGIGIQATFLFCPTYTGMSCIVCSVLCSVANVLVACAVLSLSLVVLVMSALLLAS